MIRRSLHALGYAIAHVLFVGARDPEAVVEQVRRAHAALPSLRHGLVVARKPA